MKGFSMDGADEREWDARTSRDGDHSTLAGSDRPLGFIRSSLRNWGLILRPLYGSR
jgi:hypothetical protein